MTVTAGVSPVSVPVIGTQIFIGATSSFPSPATVLGNFQKFDDFPESEGTFVDSSSINQANSDASVDIYQHKAPIPRVNVSDLVVTMKFDTAMITAAYAALNIPKAFLIQYANGNKAPFLGFIGKIKPIPGEQAGEMFAKLTIHVDGGIGWTPAS